MVLPTPSALNERAYKSAVLYFIKYCNNKYLCVTKLNKLLYYLDFISYRNTGKPLTGDTYIHEQYGPVPASVSEVLASLRSEGAIETSTVAYKNGEKIEFSLKDNAQFDESVFSADEKKLLKAICDEFGDWSTDKIVAQTHLEAPWFYSKPFEVVDYEYARDIDFFVEK